MALWRRVVTRWGWKQSWRKERKMVICGRSIAAGWGQ